MASSFECTFCFLLKWFYHFISIPIISVFLGTIGGLLVSLFVFYLQYKKSTASFRLKKVIDATKEAVQNDKNNLYMGYMRNRARYSLGVIIDSLIKSYKTNDNNRIPNHYPNLIFITGKDRWDAFNFYVRPVIQDINPYSFLGWIPFNKEMKQLQLLVTLCNAIENVVSELDVVSLIEKNEEVKIIPEIVPGLMILKDGNEKYIDDIELLEKKYEELKNEWYKWLKIIGI